jgi:methyltransferase-like protein
MIAWHQIYCKAEHVVHRRIADKNVLIPIARQLGDLQNLFAINDVAAFIFEQFDGRRTAAQICELLAERCDVPVASIEEDVSGYMVQLAELDLIRPV